MTSTLTTHTGRRVRAIGLRTVLAAGLAVAALAATPTLARASMLSSSGDIGYLAGSNWASCTDTSPAIWTTHIGTGPFYLGMSVPMVSSAYKGVTQRVLWAYSISWYNFSTRRWVTWYVSPNYYTNASDGAFGQGYSDWRDVNTGMSYVPRSFRVSAGYAWRVTWAFTWMTNGVATGRMTYLPLHEEIWDTAGAYDARQTGDYCTTYPTWE